jgi:hypothetical protein
MNGGIYDVRMRYPYRLHRLDILPQQRRAWLWRDRLDVELLAVARSVEVMLYVVDAYWPIGDIRLYSVVVYSFLEVV